MFRFPLWMDDHTLAYIPVFLTIAHRAFDFVWPNRTLWLSGGSIAFDQNAAHGPLQIEYGTQQKYPMIWWDILGLQCGYDGILIEHRYLGSEDFQAPFHPLDEAATGRSPLWPQLRSELATPASSSQGDVTEIQSGNTKSKHWDHWKHWQPSHLSHITNIWIGNPSAYGPCK